MKKIIYLLFAVFLLNSCDVSVDNPNTITTATFWKTETDAQYGINAVYNMFYKPGTYSRWLWFRLDLTSDEGVSQSPWAELKEWTQFQYRNYNFWKAIAGLTGIAMKQYSEPTRCCTTFPKFSLQMKPKKTKSSDRHTF